MRLKRLKLDSLISFWGNMFRRRKISDIADHDEL